MLVQRVALPVAIIAAVTVVLACGGDSDPNAIDAGLGGDAAAIDAALETVQCTGSGSADAPLPAQDTCNSDPGIELGVAITDPEAEANPHHIRFANSSCMTGAGAEGNSGITLMVRPGATRLVIYLQGGGLCVDDLTCAGVRNPDGLSTDPNILITRDWILEGGTFFRDAPFADAHQVFVHYCSGDFHAGDRATPISAPGTAIDGRVYTGRANLAAFLGRLVPTFGKGGIHQVDDVILTGSSAGGLGTIINYDFVQTAFGCTPVHAFIDSAPPVANDTLLECYQTDWNTILNIESSLPPSCPNCTFAAGGARNIMPHLAASYPGRRFGWFSSTRDCVLRQLVGIPSPSCSPSPTTPTGEEFTTSLEAVRSTLTASPNFRMFLYPGDWHTVPIPPAGVGDAIKGPDAVSDRRLQDIEADGTNLQSWLSELLDPTAVWSHACDQTRAPRDELTTCD